MRGALPALSLLLAASACAQPAIAPPQVGFLVDAAGAVHRVYGLAGNFLIGQPIVSGAISAASSSSFGWVKTDAAVEVTDSLGQVMASADAPPGPALFAFDAGGNPALAYLPASNALLQWNDSTLTPLSADWPAIAADAVLSIAAPDPDHAALLIERNGGIWEVRVLLSTGEVDSLRAVPGVMAPAFLLASGGVVSRDGEGIVLHNADGSTVHIPAWLPRRFSLQQMGDGWLLVRDLANDDQSALRITKGHEGFYALPEASR